MPFFFLLWDNWSYKNSDTSPNYGIFVHFQEEYLWLDGGGANTDYK